MAFSALDDKAREPTDADVAEVLGDASPLWIDLKALMASQFDPLAEDWTFSGKKWGWSLRLKNKKRAILYMTPSTGFFHVGFALGEKAVAAAHERDLPQSLLEIIDKSQKYAEGRAVRLQVRSPADLENVIKVATIKMAN
jgi:hypothetical protein